MKRKRKPEMTTLTTLRLSVAQATAAAEFGRIICAYMELLDMGDHRSLNRVLRILLVHMPETERLQGLARTMGAGKLADTIRDVYPGRAARKRSPRSESSDA